MDIIFAGDTVEYQNRRFRVDKVARVNYQVTELVTGGKFVLRIHPSVKKVESAAPTSYADQIKEIEKEQDNFAPFVSGVVVRLADESRAPNKWNYKKGQLFVVLKHNYDRVNIAKLGGDGNRYWRMSPKSLEVVPVPES